MLGRHYRSPGGERGREGAEQAGTTCGNGPTAKFEGTGDDDDEHL